MKKLLIVEDDQYIRETLKELLEDEGFEVVCSENGQKALALLRSTEKLPNLILLDLMMPIMDGYSFRTEQDQDQRIAGIPVVIMTADGRLEIKKEKAKACDYLKKPLNIDSVLSVIQKHCS